MKDGFYPMKIKKLLSFYPYWITALVLLLCIAVHPMHILGHTTYENASLEDGIYPNLKLEDGSVVISEFTPAHAQLDEISFRFLCSGSAPDGIVSLKVVDANMKEIYESKLESGDIMNYRWISFPIDASLKQGTSYYILLHAQNYDAEDAALTLYCGGPSTAPEESGQLYYNGNPESTLTPAVIYSYTDRVDSAHALPFYIAILLIGLILFSTFTKFENTPKED